jgi:hypothetical protein
MDSNSTGQPLQTTTSVRRVAIIGTAPGLGLRPTLLAPSPRFQAEPPHASIATAQVPAIRTGSTQRRRTRRRLLALRPLLAARTVST